MDHTKLLHSSPMIADAFSAVLQVRKGKTNKSTGSKHFFCRFLNHHQKITQNWQVQAVEKPRIHQWHSKKKRNDEKRSAENEELNEGIAKKSKSAPKCKFLPQWKVEFPWVVFQEDQNVMTCKICCSRM